EAYPRMYSRKGVKAMMYVVTKIMTIAPNVATTKTFISVSRSEKISSNVSSFRMTSLFLLKSRRASFFRFLEGLAIGLHLRKYNKCSWQRHKFCHKRVKNHTQSVR